MKAVVPQLLMLPLFAWFTWTADLWTAASLQYPSYLVVGMVTCGLLLLPLAFERKRAVAVVPVVWLLFLCILPWVPNSSLKPLLRGANALHTGMDRTEVLETLASRYDGTSYPAPVVFHEDDTRLCLKPRGRDSRYDAECLMVYFEDGRFRHAEFSAD